MAYDVSLQDAVKHWWAKLSSKGDFFGDDVAITIDDQNVPPPPSNTINITLYLEFWGSLATEDNVNAICGDIAKAWDGVTTSSGQKIQVGFVTRTAINANAPPNTPGFDDIQLVGKGFRSYVTGSDFGVNYGTGSGVWEVGGDPGEYAHETGHLMGLPDRYDDYNKQSDGSWVDSKTSKTFANDDDFANYIHSKYPNGDLNAVKDALKNTDTYSVAWDGHENDLMGDLNGRLLQSDIDQIAGHPGLLVHVPEGTVFADRADDQQNLIVIHSDDIFAGPGQKRRLNGIYAACIDHFKFIPDSLGVFDVAPPVDQWTGIQAATYMAMLLHYVDSAGLYCPLNFATQEAIWRLSDNASSVLGGSVDQLLADAGVDVGNQILDFPRLSGGSTTDSSSHLLVPNQLYVSSIRPAFAAGQTGTASNFTATNSHPLGVPPPTGFSWTATGPDGAPASITGTDSTASLTPSRSGIYEIALQVTLNDSLNGQKTFTSDHKSYVIVPDAYTETFEHAGLTDRFPWKSYGDVPWTITNTYAETGSYAATPGPATSGQSSTLGIEVSLPADSVIIFSVRSFTESFFDGIYFSVDSLPTAFLGGASEWTIQKFPLSAGRHLLTWTYNSASSTPGVNLWLDNIFFPGNVVVTSVADAKADVPTVFALEQNYPNPFNPTTIVRYQVPVVSNVKLVMYDVLGREVATLVNERKVPGRYQVTFDGSGLASGMYFYRLTAGSFVASRRMILLK